MDPKQTIPLSRDLKYELIKIIEWISIAYRVLVGKPDAQRPLGRPRRRWEDNIRTDLQDVRWGECMDWTDLAQDMDRWRVVVNAVMNLRVP